MQRRTLLFLLFFFSSISNFAQILNIGDTLKLSTINYGLVGYFPFNGDAKDSSGLGNHGTEKNGVALTTDRFGNPNSAYLFDGINDFIEIADANSLDLTDSFTITLWMDQYSSAAGGYRLFDKTTVGINDGYNFDTYGTSGRKLRLTGGSANVEASVTIPLNTWNQVLVSHYKDSTYLYQNSQFIGKGVQKNILANNLTARIGSNQNGGNYFNGKIDDIRIYNRSLCDLEIKVVYGLILKLNVSTTEKICENTATTIKVVNPQPYIKYRLLKQSDSSQVGSAQTSVCSDTLYFNTGSLTQNTSFIYRAIDDSKNDSIYLDTIITITVNPKYTGSIDTFLCGSSTGVFFNGQLRTDTGYYVGNFKSVLGCDSTVTLHIIKNGAEVVTQNRTICNGDSVFLAGSYRKIAGNYYDTFTRAGNCDSVNEYKLSVKNPTSSYQFRNICLGDSIAVNGKYYKNQGIFSDTLTNSQGCDSLLSIEIKYNQTDTATKNVAICSNDSLKISSKYYRIAGTYIDTIYAGICVDSLVTINLNVVNGQLDSSTVHLCEGDSITINNKKIGSSGTYYDSLKNKNGCDSILKYTVIVHGKASSTFTFRFCYTDSIFYDGIAYHTDTVFYDTLTTSFGCDSILVTILDAGGVIPDIVDSAFFCEDKTTIVDAGNYNSYLWSDGSSNRYFSTINAGPVWVTLKDSFNCTFTDTVLFIERCSPQVYIPTSFTPNGDGKNDFLIFSAYNVDQIDFKLFNRWGEIVFETKETNIAWDGTYKNTPLPVGLYHWIVNYRGRNIDARTEIKNDRGLLFIMR